MPRFKAFIHFPLVRIFIAGLAVGLSLAAYLYARRVAHTAFAGRPGVLGAHTLSIGPAS